MARKKAANPFYFVLVVVGIAFVVTACAYGVMAFRQLNPAAVAGDAEDGLMAALDRHGGTVLIVEVVLLTLFAVLAMQTDSFWDRRAKQREASIPKKH